MNQLQRRSINFYPSEWARLHEIALKQGFRSRHEMIRNAIVKILAENAKILDAA